MQNQGSSRIRLATSDPKLKDKIQINLGNGSLDSVYWYIRFNIPLDEKSVNENSMEVTDTEGYIMRTDISYQSDANRIVISPLDSYEEERYYLLKISKKVRSAKGQNLKTIISILFKLYQGAISEYKILRKDVPVPPSRTRPPNYDVMQKNRVKNDLDNYVDNLPKRKKMETDSIGMNIWLGLLGLPLIVVGIVIANIILIIIALLVCLAGVAHIFVQWSKKEFRAKIHYNKGVRFFNRMQYTAAKTAFEKSLEYYPEYQLAKYGMVRIGIYNK
ncbi:MAG: hypothetical protein FWE05_01775 [Defluviitaleaceae bacterium]|nr:hypothetical protein [Defluviitaleaceae bacterium]